MTALLAFLSGFFIDVLAVLWTRCAVRDKVGAAVLCSMLLGTAQVCGLGAAVRDARLVPFFVAGYGAGTWAIIWLAKMRRG